MTDHKTIREALDALKGIIFYAEQGGALSEYGIKLADTSFKTLEAALDRIEAKHTAHEDYTDDVDVFKYIREKQGLGHFTHPAIVKLFDMAKAQTDDEVREAIKSVKEMFIVRESNREELSDKYWEKADKAMKTLIRAATAPKNVDGLVKALEDIKKATLRTDETDRNIVYGCGVIAEKALSSNLDHANLKADIDINDISIGDKITYRDGAVGEVFQIVEKVYDGINHSHEENILYTARFFVKIGNGGERYYTHRKDGVCTLEPSGDIVSIDKKEKACPE